MDLHQDERGVCDDLITKLARYGRLRIVPDDASRAHLWARVFDSRWSTKHAPPEVKGEITKRKFDMSSYRIGILREDASPASPSRKRGRDGSTREAITPTARRAGQPAFIRVGISGGTNGLGVDFSFTDATGKTISTNVIQLDAGTTMSDAMAMVVGIFDSNEVKRVNEWNISVVVSWARQRLRVITGNIDDESVEAARLRVAGGARAGEDENRLYHYVSPQTRFNKMLDVLKEVKRNDAATFTF